MVSKLGTLMLDAIYPRRCASCGERGAWVCADCLAITPTFAPPWCTRCGIPPSVGRCRCADMPRDLDAFRSLGAYAGWIKDSIHQLKFSGEHARDRHLGELLAGQLADLQLPPDTMLVAVPLHVRRLRERGYNQSEKIARIVAEASGHVVEHPLARIRETSQQAKLDAAQRVLNVAGAFAVTPPWEQRLSGRTIVVVDDVTTTGSTIGACATPLKDAGASAVIGLAIARHL